MADDLEGNLADLAKRRKFMESLRDFGREIASLKNGPLAAAEASAKAGLAVNDLSTVTAAKIKAVFPNVSNAWATRSARYVKTLAAYVTKFGADVDGDKVPPNVPDEKDEEG